MYILGLSGFAHDSSACLLEDGRIKWLIEEERLNRKKHTWEYPARAIAECLRLEGITINDVDHVTFFWDPRLEVTGNVTHVLKYFPQSLGLLSAPSGSGDGMSFLK